MIKSVNKSIDVEKLNDMMEELEPRNEFKAVGKVLSCFMDTCFMESCFMQSCPMQNCPMQSCPIQSCSLQSCPLQTCSMRS